MKHIYCISGFGADERVFSKISVPGNDVHFIKWLSPLQNEPIAHYASRMRDQIRHENPVLFGLSFGGIMGIEIAKTIHTEKVIIISSVKTYHEMPRWMRLTGKMKLDKMVPLKSFDIIKPVENYNLGIENKEELQLVNEYRGSVSPEYTRWAVHQILNWKNEWIPENMIHIHGKKDHIFPVRYVKADYIIDDGGHFMIMNKADKVNSIFKKILEQERAA
ncbi:MAG TPA: alpha/beta hydrolase [Chitinophagaceae bacterium]|nr:alpha/beta hydrolase [Chitinophagaceae bacterium]